MDGFVCLNARGSTKHKTHSEGKVWRLSDFNGSLAYKPTTNHG